MKVLLLNDLAAPVGGAELQTHLLLQGLRMRGHDARLFASSASEPPGHSHADYSCYGTTSSLRVLVRTANFSAYQRLRTVLSEFRPDVVHVRMFLTELSPLILPLLRDVPALYHAAWYESICPTGVKLLPNGSHCEEHAGTACYRNGCVSAPAWPFVMLQSKLWQRWRGAFNLTVANSHAVRQKIVEAGIEPVEVIWNGVQVSPARAALLAQPTIACAGRMVREKGIDVLLKSFRDVLHIVPQARLILAGDGPEKPALMKLAADLGITNSVEWLGHVTRESLVEHLGGAWAMAVPSLWAEPFGLVAPEAMMRGNAVVASACGGLAEIVKDGETGILVPPGDVHALTKALVQILQNRAIAEQMGMAGRERALEFFSAEAFVDQFVERYEQMLSEHSKPGTACAIPHQVG